MTNGLYLQEKIDAKPFLEGFLSCIDSGVPDLLSLELCAVWERMKPHYELMTNNETAEQIEKRLREGASRYLSQNVACAAA